MMFLTMMSLPLCLCHSQINKHILLSEDFKKEYVYMKYFKNIGFEIMATVLKMLLKLQSYLLVESMKQLIPSIQFIFYIKVSVNINENCNRENYISL